VGLRSTVSFSLFACSDRWDTSYDGCYFSENPAAELVPATVSYGAKNVVNKYFTSSFPVKTTAAETKIQSFFLSVNTTTPLQYNFQIY
jgi:hypothetical protein